ncbi:MAG: hypothetical protein GY797_28195 [Deltaproteobacteria bacterium]|nr:hypothetical protein [Deltaproteobacteria bacterium]
MAENNIISFVEYLKKKNSKLSVDGDFIEVLGEDIKNRPELIEWYSFQNTFHKHKLFLHSLFTANQRNDNVNPNAGYFVSFSEEQINQNINNIVNALEWFGRDHILIEAKDCTFKSMAKQLKGANPNSTHDAWIMFEEILLKSNEVVIISNMSQSKIPTRKSWYAGSLIKINDDAHFRGIKPQSDILFVDYACFLQRSWSELGSYIDIFT